MTLLSAFAGAERAMARFARWLVEERTEFTCGQCERNARCGLAPNQECTFRLIQIADRQARPARWPVAPFGMG